jgi:hypothetical protein
MGVNDSFHLHFKHTKIIRMEDAVLMINRFCIYIHTTKTDRSFHLFLRHSQGSARRYLDCISYVKIPTNAL